MRTKNYLSRTRLLAGAPLLMLPLLFQPQKTAARHECGNRPDTTQRITANRGVNASCGRQSAVFNSFFQYKENFIPWSTSAAAPTVTKKIKVRFNIGVPPGTTKLNYDQNDLGQLQTLVTWFNNTSATLDQPTKPQTNACISNNCYIPNARLTMELTGISFFNYTDTMTVRPDYRSHLQNEDSVLNVFFVYLHYPDAYWNGYANPLTNDITKYGFFSDPKMNYIVMARDYYNNDLWGTMLTLRHEIYHEFGLWHLFDGTETCSETDTDYLRDLFNTGTNKSCPQTGAWDDCDVNSPTYGTVTCNNNSMARRHGYSASPMQLGIIHREAFMGRMARYCYPVDAPNTYAWVINEDQTWDFGIRMYQDIVVKAGKTLTLKCEVQMPPGGKITVEKGGKLVLDGGHITSYHPKASWKGIELYGDKLLQPYPQNQGSLELKNEAIIEYAEMGVQDFISGVYNGGGIISASNSTFKDCRKAVGLNDYPDYPRGTSCSFYNVRFITENRAASTNQNLTGIGVFTAYNEKGIYINKCRFENRISLDYMPMANRTLAIWSQDAGFRIEGSAFKGFKTAIYPATASNTPQRSVKVINCQLDSNGTAILFADNFSFAQDNTVTHMLGYSYMNGNLASYRIGSGIEAENVGGLTITRNTIIQDGEYAIGISVTNSNGFGARVLDNRIEQTRIGIQTQKNNPALDIICNNIKGSSYGAIVVNPQSSGSYYLKNQGSGCGSTQYRPGNIFTGNSKDIVSNITNPWTYWCWGNITGYVPVNNSGTFTVTNCNQSGADPNPRCNLAENVESSLDKLSDDAMTSWVMQTEGPVRALRMSSVINKLSDANEPQKLISFLESIPADDARKLLIPLYLETGNDAAARSAIDALTLDEADRKAYNTYYQIIARIRKENIQPFQISEEEKSSVRSIAAASIPGLSDHAKSFMEFACGDSWPHVQEQVTDIKTLGVTGTSQYKDASQLFDAAPNPTHASADIRVHLAKEHIGHASLQVRNIQGKVVKDYDLKLADSTVELSTFGLQPGIYIYSLVTDGRVVASRRLTVVH